MPPSPTLARAASRVRSRAPARAVAAPVALLACVAPGVAAPLAAQEVTGAPAVTLQTWADDAWLRLLDRDAAIGGRLGALGGLRRFQPTIGRDYRTDLLALQPSLLEDAAWHARDRGVRFLVGSVDRVDLMHAATVRQRVRAGRFTGELRVDAEQSPELRRILPRLRAGADVGGGVGLHVEATLPRHKPDLDVAFGATWRRRRVDAALDVAVLDAPTNYNYRDENTALARDVPTIGVTDTAVRIAGRQPLAARGRIAVTPIRTVTIEAHGATMTRQPTRLVTGTPDGPRGFVQEDRAAFGGMLVRWTPRPWLVVGGTTTVARWRAARPDAAFADGRDDERTSDERTSEAGAFVAARVGEGWELEARALRMERTERRDRREGVADVDFADAAWMGRAGLTRRFAGGARLGLVAVVDDRHESAAPAPSPPARTSTCGACAPWSSRDGSGAIAAASPSDSASTGISSAPSPNGGRSPASRRASKAGGDEALVRGGGAHRARRTPVRQRSVKSVAAVTRRQASASSSAARSRSSSAIISFGECM